MISRLLRPEVQEFIRDHRDGDPFLLSLKTQKNDDFPWKEAVFQIEAYQKASKKIPSWVAVENIIWPPPVSVEQSSSEIAARYKASLLKGRRLADLTGGMGIDSFFFAERFEAVDYVETDERLAVIAQHNFNVLGKMNIVVHHSTAEGFIRNTSHKFDAIFIDPSRREDGRRVFRIEDCTPDLTKLVPACMKKSQKILLKLSPLIDLKSIITQFSPVEIRVVASANEVKEVLCLIGKSHEKTTIFAVDLRKGGTAHEFSFTFEEEEKAEAGMAPAGEYLYEPSAAILKAGAFRLAGLRYGLAKLHPHTHLYTSDELAGNFSGRVFRIVSEVRRKNDLKSMDKVNVLTRNYPITPGQIKKKYGLKDGGDLYLIGATVHDGKKKLFLCERVY